MSRLRRSLAHFLVHLADWVRGPDRAIDLCEADLEIMTPSAARRIENAYPELVFGKPSLGRATRQEGWVVVGGATIHGLGAPAHFLARRENRRHPAGETLRFWARHDMDRGR